MKLTHAIARGSAVVALALASPDAFAQPVTAPQGAQPASRDPVRMTAAQQRFDRGRTLFEQHDYAGAIPELRASLDLYSSPNTRLYLGLCLLQTGSLAEAHAELQRTHAEARDRAAVNPNFANTRDLAEREIAALRPRLAQVVVRVAAPVTGMTVRVGATEVLPAMFGLPIFLDPGEVTVVSQAPGYVTFRETQRVGAGEAREVVVGLTREPPRNLAPPMAEPVHETARVPVERVTGGGVRTAGFVVMGVGALGLGAFALFGSFASSSWDDANRTPPTQRGSVAHRDMVDAGERWQLLANIGLGVGIGLVATSAVMIAVGGPRVTIEEEEQRRTARVTPWIDLARGAAGVSGAF